MHTSKTSLDIILNALFEPYRARVPMVSYINEAMIKEGLISEESEIINDHIAFRTLGVSNLGIASFEKIFLHYGYEKRDAYVFEGKKLNAYWYAPPNIKYPRIFLSELRVKDLSLKCQEIIHKYTENITSDPVDSLDLDNSAEIGEFFHKPLWHLPTKEDYLNLLKESEYAAWVIYNRYYLNHYTISIHNLAQGSYNLEKFNSFLEHLGVTLNSAGGKIKTSKDGLLKQSSTVAEMIKAVFAGGEALEIAGSYVEFAERLPLPEFQHLQSKDINRTQRREGFESANADKIFESTFTSQTKQRLK